MERPKSMRARGRLLALAGGATLSLAATVGVSAAWASEVTSEEQLSVVRDGTTFFTPAGVSAHWGKWVGEFTGLLPTEYRLPTEPTEFFATDDEHELFEDGLPQAILSRHARCAWLGVALGGSASPVDVAEASGQLARYAEYPGVAAGLDVTEYERQIREAAHEYGRSAQQWEHEIECEFFDAAKEPQR